MSVCVSRDILNVCEASVCYRVACRFINYRMWHHYCVEIQFYGLRGMISSLISVGQTLFSRIEGSNWFQQRFDFDSFKVILFLLVCLPLTLSYSYFFSCSMVPLFIFFFGYPSLVLNHVYHLIALQQQFFVASGMCTSYFKYIINVIPSSKKKRSIIPNNTEEEGRNEEA